MPIRQNIYALNSNSTAISSVAINSGDTITTDAIPTGNIFGNPALIYRLLDTGTVTAIKEVSNDKVTWYDSVGINGVSFGTIFSANAADLQWVSLAYSDTALSIAPWTRFSFTAHRSVATISVSYIQQEEN